MRSANIYVQIIRIVLLILLTLPSEGPLRYSPSIKSTGLIGVDLHWGYFADDQTSQGFPRRYPSVMEAMLFHSGAEIWTNLYPGDWTIEDPTRALYFFDAILSDYGSDVPTIINNLTRYENRIVIFISEPNNPDFQGRYASPEVTASRMAAYFDFAFPLCPTCRFFGPTLVQPGIPNVPDPFVYEQQLLESLKNSGRQDVIKHFGVAMNFYQRGKSTGEWGWEIQSSLRKLRSISVSYGGVDQGVIPEWGSPFGGVDQQSTMAADGVGIFPILRAESVASFYFCGPFCIEYGRGFSGKGNTHNKDYSLTGIGRALGLRSCIGVKNMSLLWPSVSISELMQAAKCGS